jgi:uncharacterized protein with PQ loop repeat
MGLASIIDLPLIDKIAFVAAIVLPLFNIPLIIRMVKRKSSEDISLWWVFGVWACILLMAPASFQSEDVVWRFFNYNNILMFTAVVFTTIKYRKSKQSG